MRVLVVDDEPLARERLCALLAELGVDHVVTAANGMQALALCAGQAFDLVLLDIRMPGLDGLETARRLSAQARPPGVVFTTAHGEHALEAFEAEARDYLLKPIRRERLARALQRVAAGRRPAAGPRAFFAAQARGALLRVPVQEVRALQAGQKYVSLLWPGGELLLEESLKGLEREFQDRFLRVHRNALVAPAHVVALEREPGGEWAVRLHGLERRLVVSRRLLAEVRRRLRAPAPG